MENSEILVNQSLKKKIPNAVRKVDRKNARKLSKIAKVIGETVHVELSDELNEWLVVWGIGIATGTGKNEIIKYFNPSPDEVRMFLDETFIFVRYNDIQSGQLLREKYHGVEFDKTQTLYVQFIDKSAKVPEEDVGAISSFGGGAPEGMTLIEDFVGAEEEENFMKMLADNDASGSKLKKRNVYHFGYEFRYGSNDVDINSPLPDGIPDYIQSLIGRLVEKGIISFEPDQVTVNQYWPGQGIPPHCDTHSPFEGPILSISLGSEIVMDFRQGSKIFSVVLPSRSLLVMDGEIRYGWTHGITPRKYDIVPDKGHGGLTVIARAMRVSLTFRKVQKGQRICSCLFPNLCDVQKGRITIDNAEGLEKDLVHRTYDKIGDHFGETRHKPWPKVKSFVENIPPGSTFLDVGCANGKYFGLNQDILEIGLDMAVGLLQMSFQKGFQVIQGSALMLPFKDNYFDSVVSIAVLHHMSTEERRLKFLNEISRVLRPGGNALIYVWSKEQNQSTWSQRQSTSSHYKSTEDDEKLIANYSFLSVHNRSDDFEDSDVIVPWVLKGGERDVVEYRYYHVFKEGELEGLVKKMDSPPLIEDVYHEQGNWVVRFVKPG